MRARLGRKGFSLIEVAITMTIAGLALGAYLQYTVAQREKARYEITKKRLGDIRTALTVYAATKGRLPCPESPKGAAASKFRQARFSMETGKDGFDYCAPDAAPPEGVIVFSGPAERQSAETSREIWTGAIPARELRLNEEQAFDGWGRLFTFSVSRQLTLPDGLRGNPMPPGMLTVANEKGDNILDVPGSGRYVVLSHGPTGGGGWTADGGQKPCEKGALDSQNCDGDGAFVIAPFAQARGKAFFDDFVIHDDPDAGGTLLDRLMRCNAKKKFYTPGDKNADADGCTGPANVLEGACVHSASLDPSGKFVLDDPVAIFEPAVIAQGKCGCQEGYKTVQVGAWDDSARKGRHSAWLSAAAGTAQPGEQVIQTGEGQEAHRDDEIYTRTALYSCVQ